MRYPIATPFASLLLSAWILAFPGARCACAQVISQENSLSLMAPQYEEEARRLRDAAPQKYDFSKAMLSDVLRFLATDAGISFFSLPDDSPDGSKLITFSIEASPFRVLETLCKANGLAILPDNGIWYIRPADDRELIGKSYQIRHNSLEPVDYVSAGSLTGGTSGTGSGSGGGGGAAISAQAAQKTFTVGRSQIVAAVRDLLGLPPETVGPNGMVTAGGNQAATALTGKSATGGFVMDKPKVIWMSDTNTLYVVATRLQHVWVEGYLSVADKPQALIAIEVKFIETSKDPRREFGIDWTGTLESGTFRQVDKLTTDPATGLTTVETTNTPTSGGYRMDLAPLLGATSLLAADGGVNWMTSVLSAQDLNLKLRAIMRDEQTNTTSYPRMVTLNNREVAIRSVVNQPVLDSSSTSVGTGATLAASSITYLPIGTVLNILPKKMDERSILLNMDVTVSSIVGETVIDLNPYPIASSRVYNAPVQVESGYTVAVGGLDEARERESEAGVPFLSKVPGLKWLFKYRGRTKNHKNLMLFITPSFINPNDGGLPEEPQSIVPQRPNHLLPHKPRVDYHTGALAGGMKDLPNAVAFLHREADKLEATINESRILPDTNQKIRELKIATDQMIAQCQQMKAAAPASFASIDQQELVLQGILTRLSRMARALFSKNHL